jgi:small subunit ribosomal protein S20
MGRDALAGQHLETGMANTKSAQKAVRRAVKRTAMNKSRRSAMRTQVGKVEDALLAGDATKAGEAMKLAEPALARSAQKGLIHKNTAARKVARLTAAVRKLAATPAS